MRPNRRLFFPGMALFGIGLVLLAFIRILRASTQEFPCRMGRGIHAAIMSVCDRSVLRAGSFGRNGPYYSAPKDRQIRHVQNYTNRGTHGDFSLSYQRDLSDNLAPLLRLFQCR